MGGCNPTWRRTKRDWRRKSLEGKLGYPRLHDKCFEKHRISPIFELPIFFLAKRLIYFIIFDNDNVNIMSLFSLKK